MGTDKPKKSTKKKFALSLLGLCGVTAATLLAVNLTAPPDSERYDPNPPIIETYNETVRTFPYHNPNRGMATWLSRNEGFQETLDAYNITRHYDHHMDKSSLYANELGLLIDDVLHEGAEDLDIGYHLAVKTMDMDYNSDYRAAVIEASMEYGADATFSAIKALDEAHVPFEHRAKLLRIALKEGIDETIDAYVELWQAPNAHEDELTLGALDYGAEAILADYAEFESGEYRFEDRAFLALASKMTSVEEVKSIYQEVMSRDIKRNNHQKQRLMFLEEFEKLAQEHSVDAGTFDIFVDWMLNPYEF